RTSTNCCISPAVFSRLSQYPAPPELYTLSLHDALPISLRQLARIVIRPEMHEEKARLVVEHVVMQGGHLDAVVAQCLHDRRHFLDRKSTRLNSSHQIISYAVFCLKKKKR